MSSSSDPECVDYFISDITSPWGLIGSISVSIPSDVMKSMVESLTQVQEQFRPIVTFTDPSYSSLTSSVVEGDSDVLIGSVVVVNTGAFGSFANITASCSSPWIRVTPTAVSGVAKNESASFDIWVIPSLMLSGSSPYSGSVVFQDGMNSVTSNISVVVNPRPEILLTPTVLGFTYNISSDVIGSIPTLDVENSGPSGSILNFTVGKVQNTSPWLIIDDSSFSDIASGDAVTVNFSLNPSSFPSLTGVYTEILRVSSTTASNTPVLIPVTLTISG